MAALVRRYYRRGLEALEHGDLELADDSLRAALELSPAFAAARIARALALGRAGDPARAVTLLRAGIPRALTATAEASLYAALGDALIALGDLGAAADAFDQVARHPAFAQRAATGRAQVLAKLGRYRESFAALATAAGATARPSCRSRDG